MPTETLTEKEHAASQTPTPAASIPDEELRGAGRTGRVTRTEVTTHLTRKDVTGTSVAALVVLVYVANVQDWWYLGSNRWAAVTMVAIGAIGCPVGARLVGEKLTSLPIVLLALLGVAALVLAVLAIATTAHWALFAFTVVVVVLWAGTTLRHGVNPPPRLAVQ